MTIARSDNTTALPALTVIGTGYLGTTHATCMAKLGFNVLAVDTDLSKLERLRSGRLPFHEPVLETLLKEGIASGRLNFTESFDEIAAHGDVHFLCVGTPQAQGSDAADLTSLWEAVTSLLDRISRSCLVVGKSTVPAGTAQAIASLCDEVGASKGIEIELAWNPEFLREGFAVQDTLHPDRVVVGVRSPTAALALGEIYAPIVEDGTPFIVTDFTTAELVKTAANAFLATKLSFINAFAEVCDVIGGDVVTLAECLGFDARIGKRFLGAGLGFGGGCLPKDIRAVRHHVRGAAGRDILRFLGDVDDINARCRSRAVELCRDAAGGSLTSKRVTVLGAAFKPDSDDIRDSPALDVATQLAGHGAEVTVCDPTALTSARSRFPLLRYAETVLAGAEGADVCLLATEWKEYADLDPRELGEVVTRRVMVDCRNVLDATKWRDAGWAVRYLGRGNR